MRIGFNKEDITPPLGAELAGYGYYLERRATHVIDRLYARALALEENGEEYLLVCADVLGLSRTVVDQVQSAMQEKFGIPSNHIMIVSIHTHTAAPFVYHEGCGALTPDYIKTGTPAIVRACEKAIDDLANVTDIGFRMSSIPAHTYNRTLKNGPVEQNVRSLHITRDGAQDIVLLSHACHAVCRGRISGISADYPGEVCRIVEQQGVHAMYVNGLCGDIDPLPCDDDVRDENLRRYAEDIANILQTEKQSLPLTLSGGKLPFTLRLIVPDSEAELHAIADAAVQKPGMIPGADKTIRIWEREMTERFDTLTDKEPIKISYLMLGGIAIFASPFEGFVRTGELLREALGDKRIFVLGCAEQLLGYMPTKEDIEQGSYAAFESTFLYKRLPIQPGEAERIGEQLAALLKEAI